MAGHMNLLQNKDKSIRISGLCRNLTKGVKWNMLPTLASDLSNEF